MEINIATKDLQNEIKSKINSSLDTTVSSRAAQTTVNEINSNVGSNSDSANKDGSVHAKLKEIRNYLGNKISNCGIKNVQRGVVSLDLNNSGEYYDISISPVDVSKAFVVITNIYKYWGGPSTSSRYGGYVKLTNSTTLQFVCDAPDGWKDNIHWQVIEFY